MSYGEGAAALAPGVGAASEPPPGVQVESRGLQIEAPPGKTPGPAAPGKTPGAPSGAARRSLSRGSDNPDVTYLQGLLNRLLGLSLPTDGSFGRRTEEAVMGYQKARGLTQDGSVGPKTWAVLESEAANGPPPTTTTTTTTPAPSGPTGPTTIPTSAKAPSPSGPDKPPTQPPVTPIGPSVKPVGPPDPGAPAGPIDKTDAQQAADALGTQLQAVLAGAGKAIGSAQTLLAGYEATAFVKALSKKNKSMLGDIAKVAEEIPVDGPFAAVWTKVATATNLLPLPADPLHATAVRVALWVGQGQLGKAYAQLGGLPMLDAVDLLRMQSDAALSLLQSHLTQEGKGFDQSKLDAALTTVRTGQLPEAKAKDLPEEERAALKGFTDLANWHRTPEAGGLPRAGRSLRMSPEEYAAQTGEKLPADPTKPLPFKRDDKGTELRQKQIDYDRASKQRLTEKDLFNVTKTGKAPLNPSQRATVELIKRHRARLPTRPEISKYGEFGSGTGYIYSNKQEKNGTPRQLANAKVQHRWIWDEFKSEGSRGSLNTWDTMTFTWGKGMAGHAGLAWMMKHLLDPASSGGAPSGGGGGSESKPKAETDDRKKVGKTIQGLLLEAGVTCAKDSTFENGKEVEKMSWLYVNTETGFVEERRDALMLLSVHKGLLSLFANMGEGRVPGIDNEGMTQAIDDATYDAFFEGGVLKGVPDWGDEGAVRFGAHAIHGGLFGNWAQVGSDPTRAGIMGRLIARSGHPFGAGKIVEGGTAVRVAHYGGGWAVAEAPPQPKPEGGASGAWLESTQKGMAHKY